MNKDINYYLGLRYIIEVLEIPAHEGGGFTARIPIFGQSIVGDGETREESLNDLDKVKEIRFKEYLSKGIAIPEPKEEIDEASNYSGKFMVRVPRFLHRDLTISAKKNGVSLNHYINNLLSINWAVGNIKSEFEYIKTLVNTIAPQSSQRYLKKEIVNEAAVSDDYNLAA